MDNIKREGADESADVSKDQDNIKREGADESADVSKDQEIGPNPFIDRETEHKIAHALGQELLLHQDPVYVVTCRECGVQPCVLKQGLYESIEIEFNYLRKRDTERMLTNKDLQLKLCRKAMRWMKHYLGYGNNNDLLYCVRYKISAFAYGEIGDWSCSSEEGSSN